MRVLICGDRRWGFSNPDEGLAIHIVVKQLKEKYGEDLTIISGGANGADAYAGEAAQELEVWWEEYPAAWSCLDDRCASRTPDGKVIHRDVHGRAAGPIRNRKMLASGLDLVLAFHNDIQSSRGTKDMVKAASKKGVKVIVYSYGKDKLYRVSDYEIERMTVKNG